MISSCSFQGASLMNSGNILEFQSMINNVQLVLSESDDLCGRRKYHVRKVTRGGKILYLMSKSYPTEKALDTFFLTVQQRRAETVYTLTGAVPVLLHRPRNHSARMRFEGYGITMIPVLNENFSPPQGKCFTGLLAV